MGFFDKKPDHPLADIKLAQRLMQDLPKNDALKSLQEISDWLESVDNNTDFRADRRFEIVQLLDETARPYVAKLAREYYAATPPTAFQESRIWTVLNNFYIHIAQAYHGLLAAYHSNDKGGATLKAHLPLITVCGIHALLGKIKCSTAHYEKVSPVFWRQLAEFYTHAESQKYADTPVKLYANSASDTTVRQKFLIALMWFAPVAGRLDPVRTHIAERLTEHWRAHFLITPEIMTDSVVCFDLAQPAMPDRVSAESPTHANMRFLSTQNIDPHIERLFRSLEKGTVPNELALGGTYEAAIVAEAVQSLAGYWTNPPPVRRNARHQVKVKLGVVRGFSDIVTHVAADNVSSETSWDADDMSATGFSCALPDKNLDGIKIGSLVGIQPEKIPHYGAGVVRRINRDEQGNLHVGIEMFSNRIDYAPLRMQRGDASVQQALLLKSPHEQAGQVRLLLGKDYFSMNHSLHTQYDGNDCLLIPLTLLEKGMDYELASYRKIVAEAAEDAH